MSDKKVKDSNYSDLGYAKGGCKCFDFGHVLRHLKTGPEKKVQRIGWNGKNMFVYLTHKHVLDNCLPHLMMHTADGRQVPWLASQTDMLAEDWQYYPGHMPKDAAE